MHRQQLAALGFIQPRARKHRGYRSLDSGQRRRLQTPQSAVLAAVVFNALIIIALIPLALRGVKYRPMGAAALLQRNLWIYGVGGIIVRSSESS